jgi:diguanylate cyclase (GGDEF)-like protein
VALLLVGVGVPYNVWVARWVGQRHCVPLAAGLVDGAILGIVAAVEPVAAPACAVIAVANLSVPLATYPRRTAAAVAVFGWVALLPGFAAGGLGDQVGVVIALALALLLVVSVVGSLGSAERAETARLHDLLDGLGAAVFEIDPRLPAFTFVSERTAAAFDLPAQQWLESPTAWLERVHPSDRHRLDIDALMTAAHEGRPVELRTVSGTWYRLRLTQRVSDLGATALRGAMVDITELRRNEELVRQQSRLDPLTGLSNRSALFDRLASLLERCDLERPVGVLLLGIDRFGDLNTRLGHRRADQVLQQVAAVIQERCADAAVVGRLRGDEFAVVYAGARAATVLEPAAERLAAALSEPVSVAGETVTLRVGIGVSVGPMDGTTPEVIINRADLAMAEAKRSGAVVRFDPVLDASGLRRAKISAELGRAVADHSLSCAFQPRIDIATGRVVACEALARWHHPDLGDVSPMEFIAVAEAQGLIRDLTVVIFRQALTAAAGWRQQGLDLDLAINVSVEDLLDRGIVDMLVTESAALDIAPRSVVLEIKEGELMREADRVRDTVQRLADVGFRLSIDDFGAGNSSMSQLRSLPIAEVKVDRAFVAGVGRSTTDEAIVRSVLELGDLLGYAVVAEGVEDDLVLGRLAELGCRQAQGFGICPPVPATTVASFALGLVSRAG